MCADQVECKRLVSTDAIGLSVEMQMSGQVSAITHLVLQNCLNGKHKGRREHLVSMFILNTTIIRDAEALLRQAGRVNTFAKRISQAGRQFGRCRDRSG
ncbi:hypothetical protein D3C76_1483300 [compost metagenome]